MNGFFVSDSRFWLFYILVIFSAIIIPFACGPNSEAHDVQLITWKDGSPAYIGQSVSDIYCYKYAGQQCRGAYDIFDFKTTEGACSIVFRCK